MRYYDVTDFTYMVNLEKLRHILFIKTSYNEYKIFLSYLDLMDLAHIRNENVSLSFFQKL